MVKDLNSFSHGKGNFTEVVFDSLPAESEFFYGKVMIIKEIQYIYFKECKSCKKLRSESSFDNTDECIVCREGLHTGEFYY